MYQLNGFGFCFSKAETGPGGSQRTRKTVKKDDSLLGHKRAASGIQLTDDT